MAKLKVDPIWLLDGDGPPVDFGQPSEIERMWGLLTPEQQAVAAKMLKGLAAA